MAGASSLPTVLVVPGLRDHVDAHWQTRLAANLEARDWGSRLVDLGEVGHLNPASGFGPWPAAELFIDELAACGCTAG